MASGLRKGLTSYGDQGFSLFFRTAFIKAMPPVLIAAIAAGAGAWIGVRLAAPMAAGRLSDVVGLAGAMIIGTCAYSVVVLLFRRALPLGKFAR